MSGEARFGDVAVSAVDAVGFVRICRGPHNFLDAQLVHDLVLALDSLTACGAAVLHSEGRNFCAGVDFRRGGGGAAFSASGGHLYDHALALFEQRLPLVAVVQGKAVGGGLGLALAADLRVGTPATTLIANFASIGLHHGFGLSVTLPAAVGPNRALDLLMTARPVAGEEAERIGLLDRVVDADPLAAASAVAAGIAAEPSDAVAAIRRTMRAARLDDVRSALARERAEQEALRPALAD